MLKPRVFISSIYLDFQAIRKEPEGFIIDARMEPIAFDRGNILFPSCQTVESACLDDVDHSDFFGMLIGGWYGIQSGEDISTATKNIKKYNSITRAEFIRAKLRNLPLHIFIQEDVLKEYEFYEKYKSTSAMYRSVDNIAIFELIEQVGGLKNNRETYIKSFSNVDTIIDWLKEQWSSMLTSYSDSM